MADVRPTKFFDETGIPWVPDVAPLGRIHPNPWNPNQMDAAVLKAERESFDEFGFLDPVTVRPHPTRKSGGPHFQIIDGEHRHRVAADVGLKKLPLVVLPDLDDSSAKKLTLILNETRGRPDPVRLSMLLRDLSEELGDRLGVALRWDAKGLDRILGLTDETWSEYDGDDLNAGPPPVDDSIFRLPMRLPPEFRSEFTQASVLDGEDEADRVSFEAVLVSALDLLSKNLPKPERHLRVVDDEGGSLDDHFADRDPEVSE